MQPFLDSSPVRGDQQELRVRAGRDGYLFFGGLLPREPVLEVRQRILEVCEQHGFLAPGSPLAEALARPGVRWREGDAEFMAA